MSWEFWTGTRRFGMFLNSIELLSTWPWEWLATLTLPEDFGRYQPATVYKRLREGWLRRLCKTEGIQVAGAFLYSWKDGVAHLHGLMLGRNRHGKTLTDVSCATWKSRWPYVAKIVVPESQEAVVKYVASHYLQRHANRARVEFYNDTLLQQTRLTPTCSRCRCSTCTCRVIGASDEFDE